MDTTLSSPLPIGLRLGTIFFSPPAAPCRRPSMPSMRGTEKPQMSASSTPTVKPLAARAAARLTVTEDLPTPPLPEATVMTRAVGGMAVSGACSRTFQRALAMAAAFSSAVSSVQSRRTEVTPGSEPIRARMSRWICARRGQPAVVRAMVTTTSPSGPTVAPLAMPSSTMSLPSSGSMTPRSSPMISSTAGSGAVVAPGGAPGSEGGETAMARILPGFAV